MGAGFGIWVLVLPPGKALVVIYHKFLCENNFILKDKRIEIKSVGKGFSINADSAFFFRNRQ